MIATSKSKSPESRPTVGFAEESAAAPEVPSDDDADEQPFDPDADPHHRLLADLADGAPVTFHGRFDNGRLSEVYAGLDALVVPSLWYENSPITIHEAFLTGTPVLASDRGGMAEFVRDGVDGLLFRLGSAADLADKMALMVEDAALRERLATAVTS